MKAVTCTNAKLEVVDRPSPAPAKGQLLLDVLRCGICGSDLHARLHCDELADVMAESGYHAFMRSNQQVVFGHEFCGEVVDYGPGTRRTPRRGTRSSPCRCCGVATKRCTGSGFRQWRRAPTPSGSSSSSR
ncbi:dehydrogenase [Mycobacterium tuberculosis]|nr:dehydrogenase [Mycobacterium tuberculosis]CKY95607.1 dehydrogenase [Mycobacterium tuberculosis]CMA07575.1 dehydrogenase [Mycobacterium tuberculosis]CNU14425.1 dehydrogenase [Mycobacterium tuberculosis]CNU52927.1 dehydrogenase [Mycobacterium tuberculosis]